MKYSLNGIVKRGRVIMNLKTGKVRITKKVMCVVLSLIIAFGTFVTITFGSSLFQKWLGVRTMLSAYAAEFVDTEGAIAVDEEMMLADDHMINLEYADGTNTAYIFSEPISFTDENGDLKTKDISIERSNLALKKQGYDYTNGQNDYRINFSKNKELGIQVDYEGYSYSISPQSVFEVEGEQSVAEYLGENFEVFQYKNIYGNGTNLRYYPQLNGVKDEIVLNQSINKNSFSFELKTDNCVAVLNENGSISINDIEGNELQAFEIPFAYDSVYVDGDDSEHISYCHYSFEEKGDNDYIFSIVVDKEWLEKDTTIYPVTIDPTTTGHLTHNKDAGVYSKHSSTNYGSEPLCCFGMSSDYGKGRAFVHFSIPDDIADYATINDAYQWERETTGRTTTSKVAAYLVTDTWTEGSITWSNKPGYNSTIKSPKKNINSASTDWDDSPYWYKFDVTNIIQAIVGKNDVNAVNYGMVFVSDDEGTSNYNWRAFAARNYSTSSYRPYTVIKYTNDTTAPTVDVDYSPKTWTNGNVTISIDDSSYHDTGGSGKSSKPYAFSQSTDASTYSWGTATTKTITQNGTWRVGVRDRAHNVTKYKKTITNIDKLKPSTPTATVNTSGWSQNNVSITVQAVDADETNTNGKSGVKYYSCTKTAGVYDWKSVSTVDTSYTFTNINNGTYYIYAKDQAGNVSAVKTITANVDPEIPVVNSVDINTNAGDNESAIHIVASDVTSGINAYSLNGGQNWTTVNPTTKSLNKIVKTTLNENSVDVRVRDLSGRISNGVIVPIENPEFYSYNGKVGIYNPNLDGRAIEYSTDNEAWKDYSAPFDITEATTVYAKYKVNQGTNHSTASEDFDPLTESEGAYTESETDLTITNNDLSFDVTRDYSSNNNEWRFSTETSAMLIHNGNIVKVNMPDKSNLYFVKTAENTFTDELNGYVLNETSDSYTFNIDGEAYSFSKSTGRLKTVAENGHSINFEYTDGVLTRISATEGTVTHSYTVNESNGKLNYIITPLGEKLAYQYTNDGLVKVCYDKDTLQFGRTDDIIISEYTYSNGRIETTNGNTVHYDNDGHYVSMTTTWNETVENEDASEPTEPEAPASNESETVELDFSSDYPVFYEGTETIHYDKSGYTLDGIAYITENEYNQSSQLITVTEQHIENYNTDNANVIYSKETTYFENCDIVHTETVIEKENDVTNTTVNTYNESSQLVSVAVTQTKTNGAGGTETVYTQNITYSYFEGTDTVHTETVTETQNGNTTVSAVEYDSRERITTESYTENGKTTATTYEYDVWGNTHTETVDVTGNNATPSHSSITYEYDALNRCTKETLSVPNENNEVTLYAYNPLDDVIYEKVGTEVTRTLYDKYGRIVQEVEPQDYNANDDGIRLNNQVLTGIDSYSNTNVGHRYVYNPSTRLLTKETNRLDVVTDYTYHTDSSVVSTETFDDGFYVLSYNRDGKIINSTVNGDSYATYSYDETTGNPTAVVYGNGQSVHYEYDNNGNLWKQYHNNDSTPYVTYTYVRSSDGTLINTEEQLDIDEELFIETNEDFVINTKTNTDSGLFYVYSNEGRVSVTDINNTSAVLYSYYVTQNENEKTVTTSGKINSKNYSVVSSENGITNIYDGNALSAESTINDTFTTTNVKVNNTTAFTVAKTENTTSDVVSYGSGLTFTDNYSSSDKHQISSSSDGTNTVTYQYYPDGQLKDVAYDGYTAHYEYSKKLDSENNETTINDNRGNLKQKTVNGETTNYTYYENNPDRLKTVNGVNLTYDSIGNVLTYGDKSYTWSSGRNLASITNTTNTFTYNYAYNKYGYRTSKTVSKVVTENNEQVTRTVTTDYNIAEDGTIISQFDGTNALYFEYAEDGTPLGFVLNDTQYLYVTNNSADVMAIADSTGNILANYSYDEWGKVTVNATGNNLTIANLNPIRYRGYYYDSETDYYYLQSRYYDPTICRFINADLPEYAKEQKDETVGVNIFVYCCNDAVNNADIDGHKKKKKKAIIYSISQFMDESKAIGKNLEKYFKKKIKVHFRKIDNNLGEKWNSTGNCDIAIINCHGNSDNTINGLSRTDVLDLNTKKVKVLILLACFAGQLTTNDEDSTFNNIASAFANIVSNNCVVVASNEEVVSMYKHKMNVTRHFYSKGREYGWTLYKHSDGLIYWYPTKIRILTIKKILNYIKDNDYGSF